MPDLSVWQERVKAEKSVIGEIWARAKGDCPDLDSHPGSPISPPKDPLAFDVHCRMLLSCLVDADRLDTAEHANGKRPAAAGLEAERRLAGLLAAIEHRASEVAEGQVKTARREILAACVAAAERPGPLFSLTVPTGGGKTLAGWRSPCAGRC